MSIPTLPTFHFVEVAETDDYSRRTATRENSGRPAVVEIQQQSHGTGQYRLTEPIEFPVLFRAEPHFTDGSAVIRAADPKRFHDPRGSAGVWGWARKGSNYSGAYIWLRVDCDLISAEDSVTTADLAKVQVQHYLTFSAFAIKALPTSTLSATLTPRTVGL